MRPGGGGGTRPARTGASFVRRLARTGVARAARKPGVSRQQSYAGLNFESTGLSSLKPRRTIDAVPDLAYLLRPAEGLPAAV